MMEQSPRRRYQKPSAKAKALQLLARRDHSEKELSKKLKDAEYSAEDISSALDWCRKQNWLKPPEQLSEIFSRHLHQRGKGLAYINNYLREKGLPPVLADQEQEIEKALAIAEKLIKKGDSLNREIQVKIMRRLISRGYSIEVARKVVYEKLRNS